MGVPLNGVLGFRGNRGYLGVIQEYLEFWISVLGSHKLGVLLGALIIREKYFRVYIGGPPSWKLPDRDYTEVI